MSDEADRFAILVMAGIVAIIAVQFQLSGAITDLLAPVLGPGWNALVGVFAALAVSHWLLMCMAEGVIVALHKDPPAKGWYPRALRDTFRMMLGKDKPPS